MNSIRASLVMMLVAAFALVSFLASLNGYRASMAEAEQLLDAQLRYASEILVATNVGESTGGVPAGVARLEADDEFAFQVWQHGQLTLRSSGAPREPINDLKEGYRYANFAGYRWRTLTRTGDDGNGYIVAERADLRHMVAEKVVLESVLPLLLWLPVSAVLVWVLVGWGLRPLATLSGQINLKRSDDLKPIDFEDPPRELVQLVESTNSLLARLNGAFEREKHFASHAAHELRTPLSVLKVHLHNLAGQVPHENNSLDHANAGVERMHHLVEQILDLNRTNPEIIEGNFQLLDLHSLAQRATADAWPAFAERQQNLSLCGESVCMSGDEVMLGTLLQNLLDNARKYTPRGGEIEVFAGIVEGGARLQVADSGPGIRVPDRERVFERFFRSSGEELGAVKGSGLGLAIVRHIVQLHGARISLAESDSGGLAVIMDFVIAGEQT